MSTTLDLGPLPRLLMYLLDGRKKGKELVAVMNYSTAVRNAEILREHGLLTITEEHGKRVTTHWFELTDAGLEIAKDLKKIDDKLRRMSEKCVCVQ